MNTSVRTSRIRRASAIVGSAVALGALVAPTAASADTYDGRFLSPGGSACISQYANYQVRADGTASNQGAKFRLYRNGIKVANSPTNTDRGWAIELRSSWGNFPGAGNYSLCAVNSNYTNTFVTLRLRSDSEF